jgi:hypothetical protein
MASRMTHAMLACFWSAILVKSALSSEERLSVSRSTPSPQSVQQTRIGRFAILPQNASIYVNVESEMSVEKREFRDPENTTPR